MSEAGAIRPTPWDTAIFGIPTFELTDASEDLLQQALLQPGHYTVKVLPLADKGLLHHYGFYYCDTLIEPFCDAARFTPHAGETGVAIDDAPLLEELLPICDHNFVFGRFHRDFNLDMAAADRRYRQWLAQLHAKGGAVGLRYHGETVGFIAHDGCRLLLHAIHPDHQGKGLAKYFWSLLCERLFAEGSRELTSSVSAANVAALNLYASLGFRFRQAVDVYHRLVEAA